MLTKSEKIEGKVAWEQREKRRKGHLVCGIGDERGENRKGRKLGEERIN